MTNERQERRVHRREVLKLVAAAGFGVMCSELMGANAVRQVAQPPNGQTDVTTVGPEPLFRISLAEWSLNAALFNGTMTNLDFPRRAMEEFGIDVVEYVNSFFKDKARDEAYLQELKQRCDDAGVRSGLIMCDGEGSLGDPDEAKRIKAVENHHQWVDAAKFMGCHSIRVNAHSEGEYEEQMKLAADGLSRLTEYGSARDINIIVENHGGLSSDGQWLAGVISRVGHPRCGTLPDFGNFWGPDGKLFDRYEGTRLMMPFAKGVSAKSYGFDDAGNETTIDYRRMLKIVVASGYRGHIGIEYEGEKHAPEEGIRLTKALLERIQIEMKGE